MVIKVFRSENDGYTSRRISRVVNHDLFLYSKICPKGCKFSGQDPKHSNVHHMGTEIFKMYPKADFCPQCGSEPVLPIMCEGHRPGNMVTQGYSASEWLVPPVYGAKTDMESWGRQCRKCGFVEFDEYGEMEHEEYKEKIGL